MKCCEIASLTCSSVISGRSRPYRCREQEATTSTCLCGRRQSSFTFPVAELRHARSSLFYDAQHQCGSGEFSPELTVAKPIQSETGFETFHDFREPEKIVPLRKDVLKDLETANA